MMDSIESYTAFALLIKHRNFSAVARKMGVSQSTVSKYILALEQTFQVQLFIRNTRSVSPTIEANHLSEHVERFLEALNVVRASAIGQTPDLDGELRVAMPTDYGRAKIVPMLGEFISEHPSLLLKITFVDGATKPAADHHDLVITTQASQSNLSLIKRTLKTYHHEVVAAPSYLAKQGTPLVPLDLENHNVLVPTDIANERIDFDSDDGRHRIRVNRMMEINDVPTIYEFARAGRAIAILPNWISMEDVANGVMQRVLTDYYLSPVEVAVVYPPTSFLSRRARLFIDFLADGLSGK